MAPLAPDEKRILHAFIEGRTEGREIIDFAGELAAAKRFMPPSIAEWLDGKAVSTALRAAGFNRAYDLPGRKRSDVIYRRSEA